MKKTILVILVSIISLSVFSQKLEDDGFSSDFHKQNAGKILFSPSEVLYQKENLNKWVTNYNWGDPIYGRIYWDEGLNNIYQKNGWSTDEGYNFEFNFYANGKQMSSYVWDTKGERTTKPICLSPANDDYYEWPYKKVLEENISSLKAGTNDIKLEFYAYNFIDRIQGRLLASGSFKLNITQEQIDVSKQTNFTSIKVKWTDDFSEWNISMGNGSGNLKTRWSNDFSEWNYSFKNVSGNIKTKWSNDYSEWTLTSDDVSVNIKQRWSNDPSEWTISDGSSSLNVKTRWSNDWSEWTVTGNSGSMNIKTRWTDDYTEWSISDNMPKETPEMKMAAIFIVIFNGMPSE